MKQEDFLDIVQKMIVDGVLTQEDAEKYFPELKESEGERIRKALLHFFREHQQGWYAQGFAQTEVVAWLEKQGEQKPTWSEDDEQLYNDLSDTYFYNDEDYPEETYKLMLKRVLDWMTKRVKSLRPQNTWKPSDEQMERLKGIINSLPHQEVLYSLYQDLQKLKG